MRKKLCHIYLQVQVEVLGVLPKGQEPATELVVRKDALQSLYSGLTLAEGEDRDVGGTKETGVDAVELRAHDTLELGVLGRTLAERRAGHDTVDVQRVTRVLRVRDRVVDERLLVLDALRLRELDHRVRVVLLSARVRVREQGVDAVDARELHAGVASLEVAAALQAQVLPALRDRAEVRLRNAAHKGRLLGPFGEVFPLLRLASGGSLRSATVGAMYMMMNFTHKNRELFYTDASNSGSSRPNIPPAPVAAMRA